jgi:hypothetical protein
MSEQHVSSDGTPVTFFWADYADDELLSLRLTDLGVELEGGILGETMDQLYGELAQRGKLRHAAGANGRDDFVGT